MFEMFVILRMFIMKKALTLTCRCFFAGRSPVWGS